MQLVLKGSFLALASLVPGGLAGAGEAVDHWGFREATPAVVHPAAASPRQYVCEKMDKAGHKVLMTRGVDLLADTPEGASRRIDHVRSEAFVAP